MSEIENKHVKKMDEQVKEFIEKLDKRASEYEIVAYKYGAPVGTFTSMKAVALKLGVCITTVFNTINNGTQLSGLNFKCNFKEPRYVRRFTPDGKPAGKYTTITSAARAILTEQKKTCSIATLVSAIAHATRSGTSIRFGYQWRRDGQKLNCEQQRAEYRLEVRSVINTEKKKRKCTYMIYNGKTDNYTQCGQTFVSEGKHNHYCSKCRERIDKISENTFVSRVFNMPTFSKNVAEI